MTRFTRQIRLAEVGLEGQARLEMAPVPARCTGFAADVERSYLLAAGAQLQPGEPARDAALPFEVHDPFAREFARGAHAALATLRTVWIGPGKMP